MTHSILEQSFMAALLKKARTNVEQDGQLAPMLFVEPLMGDLLILGLDSSHPSEEKQAYFTQVGRYLRTQGTLIQAAVFLAETWFVMATEAPAALRIPPSQHPSRQEAIVLIGRNADNTRTSSVILPFRRDAQNKPVWPTLELGHYNAPVEKGVRPVGLLDFLFFGNQQP